MTGRAPGARVGGPRAGERFAVVAARFNEPITRKLLDGALAAFATHGVTDRAVEVHWVPGSFELPQAALALARTRRYAGIVCVGVVIKGESPHFDYVAGAASGALSAFFEVFALCFFSGLAASVLPASGACAVSRNG